MTALQKADSLRLIGNANIAQQSETFLGSMYLQKAHDLDPQLNYYIDQAGNSVAMIAWSPHPEGQSRSEADLVLQRKREMETKGKLYSFF